MYIGVSMQASRLTWVCEYVPVHAYIGMKVIGINKNDNRNNSINNNKQET